MSLLGASTLGATCRTNWLSTPASNNAPVLAGTVDLVHVTDVLENGTNGSSSDEIHVLPRLRDR